MINQMDLKLNNIEILIALNHVPGMGPKTIHRLLKLFPNLDELWEAFQKGQLVHRLPLAILEALRILPWALVEKDLQWRELTGHHILTVFDEHYPQLLRQIQAAPPVLYLKGNLSALQVPLLAMIGTRQPTHYAKRVSVEWTNEFVKKNIGLVSGMALGIDTSVHTSCIAQEGITIAVLGSGIDCIYPKKNMALAEKIQERGLLISEFPRHLPPKPGQFPRRNRIISGLAWCTLVVEAAEKSGSLITAHYALEQNREVFAIPGTVGHHLSLGCHRLIQQGARLAAVPEDVWREYENGSYK